MLLKKIFVYVNLKTLNTKISTNGNMNNMPNETFFLHIFPLYNIGYLGFLKISSVLVLCSRNNKS